MGLAAAVDVSIDTYLASGAFNHYVNRPAIYLSLSKEELESAYSLYQGSGGVVSSIVSASPTGAKIHIKQEPQGGLAATVQEICSAFGLTKEELTQVCKISSRKTLYNWINGDATPRKSAMSRIFDILAIARSIQNSGFKGSRELLHRPVIDGRSIFAMLSEPEIDKELILFAASRLNIMSPAKTLADPFA